MSQNIYGWYVVSEKPRRLSFRVQVVLSHEARPPWCSNHDSPEEVKYMPRGKEDCNEYAGFPWAAWGGWWTAEPSITCLVSLPSTLSGFQAACPTDRHNLCCWLFLAKFYLSVPLRIPLGMFSYPSGNEYPKRGTNLKYDWEDKSTANNVCVLSHSVMSDSLWTPGL